MKNKNPKEKAEQSHSWRKVYNRNAFSILEMVIVMVILGILATLSVSQYIGARERALDQEAQANLRLILAAERTYRMEDNSNEYRASADIADINTSLRLLLPDASSQWDYFTRTYGDSNDDFCAQATRRNAAARTWSIVAPDASDSDPQPLRDGACP